LDDLLFEEINKQEGPKTSDGMDIALCVFDLEKKVVEFSGAFRPLVLIRNNEYIEFKGARYPIGFFSDITKEFETTVVPLQSGDTFYMFSDGYGDQFGGPEIENGGKKFNKKAFRELLLSMQNMNMEEQEGYLDYSFQNWKQSLEQIDDVLVMGIRV
jgi:serine phosphatase RsbU (regulator of sigma subunit)